MHLIQLPEAHKRTTLFCCSTHAALLWLASAMLYAIRALTMQNPLLAQAPLFPYCQRMTCARYTVLQMKILTGTARFVLQYSSYQACLHSVFATFRCCHIDTANFKEDRGALRGKLIQCILSSNTWLLTNCLLSLQEPHKRAVKELLGILQVPCLIYFAKQRLSNQQLPLRLSQRKCALRFLPSVFPPKWERYHQILRQISNGNKFCRSRP